MRTVGLLGSKSKGLLADSPDALACISDEKGNTFVSTVEIKTMASIQTIRNALTIQERNGAFIQISGIGHVKEADSLFRCIVTLTDYRVQCIHHTATVGVNFVLYTVAKGSSCGVGSILHVALLEISECLQAEYLYCLASVRDSVFTSVGKDASEIPDAYDELLQESHANDLFSYASFYNLSCTYKSLVLANGPLPPARMIRPFCLVF